MYIVRTKDTKKPSSGEFPTKKLAKKRRDELIKETHIAHIVSRSPNHPKGESK